VTKILVVDSYDSFVYTLVDYLRQLGAEVDVVRNDALAADEPLAMGLDGVLLSPGPGTPERAGVIVDLVRVCAGRLPLLGVCLGHQAIAVAYGGTVVRAPELCHGRTSTIEHAGAGVLAGLERPLVAARYHSLAVDEASLPDVLEVTARAASPAGTAPAGSRAGLVMALRHRELAVEGVQFHPESVLSASGHRLLGNWLARCGDAGAPERAAQAAPLLPAGSAPTR
jgi:para-aminobenzoate synthetase component 2